MTVVAGVGSIACGWVVSILLIWSFAPTGSFIIKIFSYFSTQFPTKFIFQKNINNVSTSITSFPSSQLSRQNSNFSHFFNFNKFINKNFYKMQSMYCILFLLNLTYNLLYNLRHIFYIFVIF